ncbi:hypothetical protein RchiOBHm_Chr6g0245881 [Rosa chinensis]|uniref:Uncharacterized protein n=1 Tax=Rosa chinensis TaxID=74649 RepID=A0A2P6PJE2_ROSCH|nr:hypothetical protein RchiOBHm_Chr6g0245881 [Rosa chinensis]
MHNGKLYLIHIICNTTFYLFLFQMWRGALAELVATTCLMYLFEPKSIFGKIL